MKLRAVACALVAAVSMTGCVVFNEECSRLMSEPEGVAGYLADDVNITKSVVRSRDNAIGQLVAESYFRAFDDQPEKYRPDLGVVNSGAIRSDGVCDSRERLPKGPVLRKHLRDVLPFDNRVLVVAMTHRQLKNVFEHAVAGYSQVDPKGAFLQIYGAEIWVNCALSQETMDSEGRRLIEGHRITRLVVGGKDIPLNPPSDTEKVRVAVDSFVQSGGDGFIDFEATDADAADTVSAGSFGFEIVAKHFAKTYTEDSPLSDVPQVRVHLEGCR